jgi:hypothetical protein
MILFFCYSFIRKKKEKEKEKDRHENIASFLNSVMFYFS